MDCVRFYKRLPWSLGYLNGYLKIDILWLLVATLKIHWTNNRLK